MGVKERMGQEWVTFLWKMMRLQLCFRFHFLCRPPPAPPPILIVISLVVISCALTVLVGFVSCEVTFPLI